MSLTVGPINNVFEDADTLLCIMSLCRDLPMNLSEATHQEPIDLGQARLQIQAGARCAGNPDSSAYSSSLPVYPQTLAPAW